MKNYQTGVTLGDLYKLVANSKIPDNALLVLSVDDMQSDAACYAGVETEKLEFWPQSAIGGPEIRLVAGKAFDY